MSDNKTHPHLASLTELLINPTIKVFRDESVSFFLGQQGLRDRINLNEYLFKQKVQMVIDRNGICTKEISLKVFESCLRGATLEEDEKMHGIWAALISNLVDKEQNIQAHIFAVILSQISFKEFEALRDEVKQKIRHLNAQRILLEKQRKIVLKLESLKTGNMERLNHTPTQCQIFPENIRMDTSGWKEENGLETTHLRYKLKELREKSEGSSRFFENSLGAWETSNLIRLGLLRQYHSYLPITPHKDEDPSYFSDYIRRNLAVITELGERFIIACTEKLDRVKPIGKDGYYP